MSDKMSDAAVEWDYLAQTLHGRAIATSGLQHFLDKRPGGYYAELSRAAGAIRDMLADAAVEGADLFEIRDAAFAAQYQEWESAMSVEADFVH
jgi:hypothetical protein